jgi:hypothetical protein
MLLMVSCPRALTLNKSLTSLKLLAKDIHDMNAVQIVLFAAYEADSAWSLTISQSHR